ncbi:MAG: hypothetical protein Q4G37_03755, partial [Bifidobacterium sp.]|nr:hypothetical protein [Bifidobacterium sp.]
KRVAATVEESQTSIIPHGGDETVSGGFSARRHAMFGRRSPNGGLGARGQVRSARHVVGLWTATMPAM